MQIQRQSIAATGTLTIGKVSDFTPGEWCLHVSGTFVGTLQTKAFTPSSGGGGAAGPSLTIADRQPVAYKVQKTGVLTDPTTTGITAPGTYVVPLSAGQVLVLECTAYTSGTIVVDPAAGVAAA